MQILFIGCVEGSYRLLKALCENNYTVVGVITKDKSNFNADFYDLSPLCNEYGIPVRCVENINEEDSITFIKALSPDIGFCFGWSQLIQENVINLFPKGVVGFHPAELPHNRGRHPLIWALALGLKETASSFFMITENADEGAIISQTKVVITYEDDARTLYDKVLDTAVGQELEFTKEIEFGTLISIEQSSSEGNSWRKRNKLDGQIDWRMSSRSIYNLVRALSKPYVGAHFVFNNQEYKVWKVMEISTERYQNIEPGKVLRVQDGKIDVKTGEGGIRLLEFDSVNVKEGDYIL